MSRQLFRVPVTTRVETVAYVMAEDAEAAVLRVSAIAPVELLQLPRRRVEIAVSDAVEAGLSVVAADGWVSEPPFYPHAEHRVYAGADTCAEILVEQESIAAAENGEVAS